MQSASRRGNVAVIAGMAALALLATLVLGAGGAEGKPKKKKKKRPGPAPVAMVVSDKQHLIVDAGQISVTVTNGKGRNVEVHAISSGIDLGAVTTVVRVAKSASLSLPLTQPGRAMLEGCSVDALAADVGKAAKKKKKRKKGKRKRGRKSAAGPSTPLDRDLAVCSVGSENPTPRPYYGPVIPTPAGCDFLDAAICMQPFPSDYLTVADPSTDTGRRLNFQASAMPRNRPTAPEGNTPIDPTDFNRADGFSPGNQIIVKLPQVETQAAFNASGLVPVTDPARYLDPNQPAVVINADTGQRHPIFAELDTLPYKYGGGAEHVNLIIRPLVNFDEGERYIVALRSLRDAQGNAVPPPMPFRVYRDRLITGQAPIEARRAQMESIIGELQGAGVPRATLNIAWDFTVASEDSLSGRGLALRNAALAELGDTTPGDGAIDGNEPAVNITSVLEDGDPGLNPNLEKQIDGVLTDVPCFLHDGNGNPADNCHPGARLQFAPGSDVPNVTPNGTADDPNGATTGVEFRCIIPKSTVAGGTVHPAKPGIFGHGLLGGYDQVSDQIRLSNQHNSVWCATKWAGFSQDDLGKVVLSLINLSHFPELTDRMLQGFVNFTYLGRAMNHPNGFKDDAAFQVDADNDTTPDGPAIDTANTDLYYEGISQGAIMGGALTALSTDFTQSVLNVPGMNYSTLLSRSTDSGEYLEPEGGLGDLALYATYPNQLERQLLFGLMQLLWDRGEANGYAHHMTDDPLADTPQHNVLLQVAPGDFQVSNLTAEIEARTMGASIHQPALHPGRHWQSNPFFDLPAIGGFPFSDSALVYYDGGPTSWFNNAPANTPAGMECRSSDPTTDPCQGSAVAPTTNVPPTPGPYGEDPHGYPRRSADALTHVSTWLQPSGFINQCGFPAPARHCYANGWDGP